MTPKERVLTAIAHRQPDRVPVGEWEYGREIVEPVLGRDTLFHCGVKTVRAYWEGRRDEVVGQWKRGLVELAHRLGWDAVLVHLCLDRRTPVEVPEQTSEKTWRDSLGNTLTYSRETDRILITKRGDAPPTATSPAPSCPDDLQPTESELEVVRHVVGALGKTHFLFAGALIGHPRLGFSDASVSEVENWVRLYEDPEAYREGFLNSVASERSRQGVETAKREGLDGVAWGCDFGYNAGPFLSPAMFRRAVLPGLSTYCDLVHSQGLVMLLHSCGNNQLLMDSIVEAGVDVYQSIQPEMNIIEMKKRYGTRITLWGGVPAGDLVTGTPEQVKQTGLRMLAACAPGGGYIYGTSHSIMPGARYENYLAMLDAHREYCEDAAG